jgi:hypothetical protein
VWVWVFTAKTQGRKVMQAKSIHPYQAVMKKLTAPCNDAVQRRLNLTFKNSLRLTALAVNAHTPCSCSRLTDNDSPLTSQSRPTFARAVLVTGLIAGTLDILAACTSAYIQRGMTPDKLLQFVASGLFGADAFSGGTIMAVVGLVMHFMIATSWTLLYYLIYPRLNFLQKNKIVSGIIYGAFVWVMMNRVILPFTDIPKSPFNLTSALIGMIILMLMIGMPNAFRAPRYYDSVKH